MPATKGRHDFLWRIERNEAVDDTDQPIGGDQPGKLSPKPATAIFTKPSFIILF